VFSHVRYFKLLALLPVRQFNTFCNVTPLGIEMSVYPAALSSFGRLCGTNTYEQKAQTPFRIDFNFSLFIIHSYL